MHIEHVAIWTHDLERLKAFYETYFDGRAKAKYVNAEKRFES
jgi:lactoylglutathione lyase